ncbi:MAG TPA: hypothetical protein P5125_05080 [Kiritimatiellia bacterium]|nr:hypothetical protein [Kiritimatiellia bacterium]
MRTRFWGTVAAFCCVGSATFAAVAPGVYPADEVPVARGSIELWVTPNQEGCDARDHVYFADADAWAREGTPTIWYWAEYVRFDVDSGKRLVYGRLADGLLEPDVPVHIVASWDAAKGQTAVYANGELVQRREVEPWVPVALERYVVGEDCSRRKKAGAVIDALHFFAVPLTPGEIKTRFDAKKNLVDSARSSAARKKHMPPPLPAKATVAPEWQVVATIDPYSEKPCAAIGETKVGEIPGCRFRETGIKSHDRFAYVRELPATNLLLRVRITYPDDTYRSLMVSQTQPDFGEIRTAGSEQQVLGSGILTGSEFPVTGKPLVYEYVFRHPSTWLGLIFEGYQPDKPGAVGPVTIAYAAPEKDRYGPAAPLPPLAAHKARKAGLYWEDPVLSMCFGGVGGVDPATYDRDLVSAMDYFSWVGQDLWFYPTVWYNGPVYRSRKEKGTWPSGMRHHPADFPHLFAARCAERDITFVPSFGMSRLPTLNLKFGTREQVIAGDQTVLNVVYADGEIPVTPFMYKPPIFNALRRETQDAVMGLVDEHCDMLADLPSFGGISFYLNHWNLTQLGLWLDGSYDDWTMETFAKGIGEILPGTPGDAQRFKIRADWIRNDPARRNRFLRWRAEIVSGFYEKVAARIRSRNSDAKLYLRLDVPSISQMCTSGGRFCKPFSDESFLEMGLDVPRLAKHEAVCLDRLFSWGIVRCERKYWPDEKLVPPLFDLEPAFQKEVLGAVDAVTIHQYYFETHGEFSRGRKLTMPAPWKNEAPGRCTAPLYPGRWPLVYYARALALFDMKEVSIGGFTLGTHGIEDLVRTWTASFRCLPLVDFGEEMRFDDVILRTAVAEGARWWYMLNTASQERVIPLSVKGVCRETVYGDRVKSGSRTLKSFELVAVRGEMDSQLTIKETP